MNTKCSRKIFETPKTKLQTQKKRSDAKPCFEIWDFFGVWFLVFKIVEQVSPISVCSFTLTTMSAEEAQLIARCRRGEAQAWDELFDAHYAATGRFIFQLASDFSREDAEEIS